MIGLPVEDRTIVALAPPWKQCTYNGPFAPTCLSLLTQQLVYSPANLLFPYLFSLPVYLFPLLLTTCGLRLTGNLSPALPITLSLIQLVILLS